MKSVTIGAMKKAKNCEMSSDSEPEEEEYNSNESADEHGDPNTEFSNMSLRQLDSIQLQIHGGYSEDWLEIFEEGGLSPEEIQLIKQDIQLCML